MCMYEGTCPFGNNCEDCLYHKKSKKRKKTGISTTNMKEYKRIYRKRMHEEEKNKYLKAANEVRL